MKNVLTEKLFGKILDDLGDKFFSFYKKISQRSSLYEQLIKLPYVRYGNESCYYGKCYNLKHRDDLLERVGYKNFFNKLNFFNKKLLVKKLINNFKINCFGDCDKYIVSLILLFDSLSKEKINKIYEKQKDNKQAIALYYFLQEVQNIKPKLIDKKIKNILKQL